jgi:hypothetical protein
VRASRRICDVARCVRRHDPRETAHLIDTARCPVYIMNGAYDPSTGFKEGEELVAKIDAP